MSERFSYSGPATIDGIDYPAVELLEHLPEGEVGLRSWSGSASLTKPSEGFIDTLSADGPSVIELPDGREGRVYVVADFDGHSWAVSINGTGPAPS
jgi:hypothetical protein